MLQDANWPIGLLASAYWSRLDPQELTMAICVGYFDHEQSGEGPATVTVAGYVAPRSRWRFFEERWTRALRAEQLTAFNGREFGLGTGEFATPWADNESRGARLIQRLTTLVAQHVFRGFGCTLRMDDYEQVNDAYRLAEEAGGPYGVCAAHVIACVQRWMAEHHADDLTLFVFEEGDVDHREIRRLASAEGIDRGEPVQVWPRQWTDDRGRRRFLRPFEACDLLLFGSKDTATDRLGPHCSWNGELLDREHLVRICRRLAVTRRGPSSPDESAPHRRAQSDCQAAATSRSSRETS